MLDLSNEYSMRDMLLLHGFLRSRLPEELVLPILNHLDQDGCWALITCHQNNLAATVSAPVSMSSLIETTSLTARFNDSLRVKRLSAKAHPSSSQSVPNRMLKLKKNLKGTQLYVPGVTPNFSLPCPTIGPGS